MDWAEIMLAKAKEKGGGKGEQKMIVLRPKSLLSKVKKKQKSYQLCPRQKETKGLRSTC